LDLETTSSSYLLLSFSLFSSRPPDSPPIC
jgi:hypothetical protein